MTKDVTILMTVRDLTEDQADAILDALNEMDENNLFPSGASISTERGF